MAISGFRKADLMEKYSDFVGEERNGSESDSDFQNRIIGSLDMITKSKSIAVDLSATKYRVVGRDDAKIFNFKSKGVEVEDKLFPIGHEALADSVLIGKMSKENPPKFFVDGYGNIFEKVA